MDKRGNTIEFPKEFLKRIKLISILENKKIRNFCMEILDEILKEYEEKYGLNKKKRKNYSLFIKRLFFVSIDIIERVDLLLFS